MPATKRSISDLLAELPQHTKIFGDESDSDESLDDVRLKLELKIEALISDELASCLREIEGYRKAIVEVEKRYAVLTKRLKEFNPGYEPTSPSAP